MEVVPAKQRHFALEVVRQLREAGFTAYWAGGCVRDQLLGIVPKDYDVATDATPSKIRELFGRRRTLALGAAFGVITVLGPKEAGSIEVATFREETTYSDGRHPDSVRFSSAKEDSLRRDFTVNGMFFDPIAGQVIDFVGGQEDLKNRLIRAIGDPHERINEDKLRMLRAVRFTTRFQFGLENRTHEAIRKRASEITVVSAERIAAEMRQMLTHPQRARAVRLLLETGLAAAVLPEIVPEGEAAQRLLEQSLAVLTRLEHPGLPLALATLLIGHVGPQHGEEICRRWRLSNKETSTVAWLLAHQQDLHGARQKRWSQLQPILVADAGRELLAMGRAEGLAGLRDLEEVNWCQSLLERPRELVDPQPLINGDDLRHHGIPQGPRYRAILARLRDAQLDGEIHSREDAMALVDRLLTDEQP